MLHPAIPFSNRHGCARRSRPVRGFTLVEVIATIVVLGAIGSVASLTLFSGINSHTTTAAKAQLHSELSVALDRIERELRKIPIKASYGSIAPNIESVTASSIAWNGNSSLTVSAGQLVFVNNGAAPAVLLDNVTGFAVTAFNESNAALGASLSGAGCDPIRRLSIQITLQRAGVTETLRTKLFLRCTMEGAVS